MNNYNKLLWIVFFAVSLISLGSCSDDEAVETPPREETLEMLAGEQHKNWMISTVQVNNFDATSSLLDECNLDDLYVFYRTGEGKILSNELKCTEDEPDQIATGSWELHDDLATMNLQLPPFFDDSVEIMDLTDDRLRLRKEEDEDVVVVTFLATE